MRWRSLRVGRSTSPGRSPSTPRGRRDGIVSARDRRGVGGGFERAVGTREGRARCWHGQRAGTDPNREAASVHRPGRASQPGHPPAGAGLTVSSVLVAEGQQANLLGLISPTSAFWEAMQEIGTFVVHVLAAGDQALAERFSEIRPSIVWRWPTRHGSGARREPPASGVPPGRVGAGWLCRAGRRRDSSSWSCPVVADGGRTRYSGHAQVTVDFVSQSSLSLSR
jgi:hypothetical protein